MSFSFINLVNAAAVFLLLLCNLIAWKFGIAGEMQSRSRVVNCLEQIGRYACMALMIVPLIIGHWEFSFAGKSNFVVWLILTCVLMMFYIVLWFFKRTEQPIVLLGLAAIPVLLFLANGVLLQHWLLLGAAVLFGTCHLWIVTEHLRAQNMTHTIRNAEK